MPEKRTIIPGSFKSRISLGTRYVPAPTPWQAGVNTALRAYAPWGPFGVDEPPTGTGGRTGKFLGMVPYAGGLLQAILAGSQAGEQQGRMVKVPPKTGWFQNLLSTIGNTMAFMPSSPALSIAKPAVSGLSGLAGAPMMFNTSWEQMLAGLGGAAVRGAVDRTGVLRTMASPPAEPTQGSVNAPMWPLPPTASLNPFVNPATGVAPAWAGGPSTWNQPQSTWGPEWRVPSSPAWENLQSP